MMTLNHEGSPHSPQEQGLDINSKMIALEAENEILKQKLLTNELADEVKEKVSIWFGNTLKITFSLMVLFGFVTMAVVYSVVQEQAKQTAAAEAKRVSEQVAREEVKNQVIEQIRQELPKEKTLITNKIAATLRDEVAKDPVLLARMYGVARDTAKNSQKLEKGRFYVVVGSAQAQADLTRYQKLATKEGFQTLICAPKNNDRYALVIGKEKDQFSLPASEATKVLQEAKSKVDLFKQNQAFTLPEARAFFTCAQPKKS